MSEKVVWTLLREKNSQIGVVVTDGMSTQVYTEAEYISRYSQKDTTIPEPKKLIGGTEVYLKSKDIPYWYCRIHNAEKEFMHLYTEDLTEHDLLYDSKTKERRKFTTYREKEFLDNVLEALVNKPEEGFRWIPVEPLITSTRCTNFSVNPINYCDWERYAKNYSPKNESDLGSIHTYFLLGLRWLKDGIATLDQLANDSKEIGSYRKPGREAYEEGVVRKEFGGLYCFVGLNTKIVKRIKYGQSYSYPELGGYMAELGNVGPFSNIRYELCGKYDSRAIPFITLKK